MLSHQGMLRTNRLIPSGVKHFHSARKAMPTLSSSLHRISWSYYTIPYISFRRARKYAYCCFYNRMPSGNITLQQFETYAVERLRGKGTEVVFVNNEYSNT